MHSPYAIAALWVGLAFFSAIIAARAGIAVSLVEILVRLMPSCESWKALQRKTEALLSPT